MKQQSTQSAASAPEIDKSRNLLGGYNMWAQIFPFINFVMFLLGWFTVPIEVLFRRNFGERWLTVINFYAGLLVLGFFTSIQTLATVFDGGYGQPGRPEPSIWDSIMSKSMLIFLLAYLMISSYHFFRMWWRNRTYSALFSFNDGTSRFEAIGNLLMQVVNIAAVPIIRIYMLMLPKEEQARNIQVPPLLEDVTAFTNTVFEPLLLLILSFIFPGTARTWLMISAAALAVYANWKETAKLNRVLDFRDTIIEAEAMANARELPEAHNAQNLILQQAAVTIKSNPTVIPQVTQRYPDLMSIIDEMNSEEGS